MTISFSPLVAGDLSQSIEQFSPENPQNQKI
jgi:hypothetical protein